MTISQPNSHLRALAPMILCAALAAMPSAPVRACAVEPYVGSICVTAASYCPSGYLLANGLELSINSYQLLYALLGTTYGGNGTSTFALPDLRGRSAVGVSIGSELTDVTLGQVRGAENTTLTSANLPSHSHTATLSSATGTTTVTIPVSTAAAGAVTSPSGGNNYLTASPANGTASARIWSNNATQTATVAGVSAVTSVNGTVSVGATGSSTAFTNLPPQLGLLHCIAVEGTYPTRY
jgi:microcystin-dependent protein